MLDERKVLGGLGRGPQGVQRRGNRNVALEDEREDGDEEEEVGDMGPGEDEEEVDEDEDEDEIMDDVDEGEI